MSNFVKGLKLWLELYTLFQTWYIHCTLAGTTTSKHDSVWCVNCHYWNIIFTQTNKGAKDWRINVAAYCWIDQCTPDVCCQQYSRQFVHSRTHETWGNPPKRPTSVSSVQNCMHHSNYCNYQVYDSITTVHTTSQHPWTVSCSTNCIMIITIIIIFITTTVNHYYRLICLGVETAMHRDYLFKLWLSKFSYFLTYIPFIWNHHKCQTLLTITKCTVTKKNKTQAGTPLSTSEQTCEKMRMRWPSCFNTFSILASKSSLPLAFVITEPSYMPTLVNGAS